MDEIKMDKLRLILRSVYLKGHKDANLKSADMSWEDGVVNEIISAIKGMENDK